MSGGRGLAVVDLGSNSLRLFLVERLEPDGPAGRRTTVVIGLRRGAAPDGSIAPDALQRLAEALEDVGARIGEFRPRAVAAVGTSAVRDAPNRDRVIELVRRATGAPLRVLSGDEEALLAFTGARLARDAPGPCLMLDVGGGSTELVRGDAEGVEGTVSLQLGSVRSTERWLVDDPPGPRAIAGLRGQARPLLDDAVRAIGGTAPALGVAGTITSLAAIELGRYDPALVHGHVLSRAGIERQIETLGAMTAAERRVVPGLDPARAPVIVAGAAITAEALHAAEQETLTVSERDILDGVALAALRPGGVAGLAWSPEPLD